MGTDKNIFIMCSWYCRQITNFFGTSAKLGTRDNCCDKLTLVLMDKQIVACHSPAKLCVELETPLISCKVFAIVFS